MPDKFTLQEEQGLDGNLRPVRLNGENTSLEIANDGNGAKVKGDLEVTGDLKCIMDKIVSTGSGGLEIQADTGIVLNANNGRFNMESGGTTFSPTHSAYAGMILGYTAIRADATDVSYNVTNAFTVLSPLTEAGFVTFVAPPSGNVEIFVSVFGDCATGGRPLFFGLSDNETYNALNVTHEHEVTTGDETDEYQINHYWVITGLTAGTSYTYWLGVKCTHNFVWALRYGGDVSAEYAPFIMKATALPATLGDGT